MRGRVRRNISFMVILVYFVVSSFTAMATGYTSVSEYSGNDKDLPIYDQYLNLKHDDGKPFNGSVSNDELHVKLTIRTDAAEGGDEGKLVDWELEDGSNAVIYYVFVKGGNGGMLYEYDGTTTSDTGLRTPLNPDNNKHYGLSHVTFFYKVQPIDPDPDPEEPWLGTVKVQKYVRGPITPSSAPYSPKGFVFTLEGEDYSETVTTDEDGIALFNDLSAGTYYLTEEAEEGYKTADIPEGGLEIELNETATDDNIYLVNITNNYTPKAPDPDPQDPWVGVIKVQKYVRGPITPSSAPYSPKGFVFTLEGEDYSETVTTDEDGVALFTDLSAGTYYLTEEAKEGYKTADIPEGGLEIILSEDTVDGDIRLVEITNNYKPKDPPKDPEDPPKDPEDPPKDPEDPPKDPEDPPKDSEDPDLEDDEIIEDEVPGGEVEIPDDEVPGGQAEVPNDEDFEVLDDEDILDDEVPGGHTELPKTGEIPSLVFYGFGGILAVSGISLRLKGKKDRKTR